MSHSPAISHVEELSSGMILTMLLNTCMYHFRRQHHVLLSVRGLGVHPGTHIGPTLQPPISIDTLNNAEHGTVTSAVRIYSTCINIRNREGAV